MLKVIDLVLCAIALGVGCLHSFIVAPRVYDSFEPNAFWFFGAGLAVIFMALLNGLRALDAQANIALRWAAILSASILFALIVVFAVTLNAASDPMVILQAVTYGGLAVMGLLRGPGAV